MRRSARLHSATHTLAKYYYSCLPSPFAFALTYPFPRTTAKLYAIRHTVCNYCFGFLSRLNCISLFAERVKLFANASFRVQRRLNLSNTYFITSVLAPYLCTYIIRTRRRRKGLLFRVYLLYVYSRYTGCTRRCNGTLSTSLSNVTRKMTTCGKPKTLHSYTGILTYCTPR